MTHFQKTHAQKVSFKNNLLASTCNFGTYRFVEQPRLERVCAYAQTRQSLRCSYTQIMQVDEDVKQSLDLSAH